MKDQFNDVLCEHCGHMIGKVVDNRLKIQVRSRLVAVTPNGVEINCPSCKAGTGLPLSYTPADRGAA